MIWMTGKMCQLIFSCPRLATMHSITRFKNRSEHDWKIPSITNPQRAWKHCENAWMLANNKILLNYFLPPFLPPLPLSSCYSFFSPLPLFLTPSVSPFMSAEVSFVHFRWIIPCLISSISASFLSNILFERLEDLDHILFSTSQNRFHFFLFEGSLSITKWALAYAWSKKNNRFIWFIKMFNCRKQHRFT